MEIYPGMGVSLGLSRQGKRGQGRQRETKTCLYKSANFYAFYSCVYTWKQVRWLLLMYARKRVMVFSFFIK